MAAADRRYKPYSSQHMSEQWKTLPSSSTATTSSTSSPISHPLRVVKAPPFPTHSLVNSASLATTIDDVMLDSEQGSLAPPNSSNTSLSRNTSEETTLKPPDKRKSDCKSSEDGKIVPNLKYSKPENEFSLGYR